MSKRYILVICLLLSSFLSFAQGNITVKGRVTDENGAPMPGAGVVQKGNVTKGTVTDVDGKFSIKVPSNAYLEFSFISYATQLIAVEGRKEINVQLFPDNNQLDATVVIGYGTSKKGDLTGAVSVVQMDEIENAPVTSVSQALQGRIAGAEFNSGSGTPGDEGSIRIRGSRSISAGNEPLIVVDGVVDAVSSLSDINPSDIKSISVLKDVSSTAIYGSRGANGVILITTVDNKKPAGKIAFRFKASAGVSMISGSQDMMNATEYAEWRNLVATNLKTTIPYNNPSEFGEGTDWIKALSRPAVYQNYYLSMWTSAGNNTFTASIGYNSNPSIIIGAGQRKLTGSFVLNSKLSKKLTLDVNFTYAINNRDNATAAITGTNSNAAIYLVPILGINETWNSFGDSENSGGMPFNSPYVVANNVVNKAKNGSLTVSPVLTYVINAKWNLKARMAYTRVRADGGYYSPSWLPQALAKMDGGTARRSHWDQDKLLGELTANYTRKKGGHTFGLLAGITAERNAINSETYSGTGYTDDSQLYHNMGSLANSANFNMATSVQEVNKLSAFVRFTENYRKKYYLTLTARVDGASNFAANRKWGFFPAAAFRWSIMNEDWFSGSLWLNNLSLRLSAGRSGNDAISPYMSLATVSSSMGGWLFDGNKQLSYYPNKLANSSLTWETTDSYNIGLDFAGWDNRVSIETDAYVSFTHDLLLSVRNSQTTGYNTYYANAGSTRNMGIEFTLTTKNFVSQNFKWNTTFTISHNNQIVTDVGSESTVVPTFMNPRNYTQYMYGYRKGYPVNALWGYKFAGVWHDMDEIARNTVTKEYVSQIKAGLQGDGRGHPKYVDVNHDGMLDENDMVYLGSADAVVQGGLQNNFVIFKRLTVGLYLTYSIGGYIYNLTELWAGSGVSSYNKYRYMKNAWTENNTSSNIVKAGFDDIQASSRHVYDASYFRVKSLSVNYDIPLNKKVRKHITGISVGVSADNLFLAKNYPGFDPDVSTSSSVYRLDNGSYPRPSTYVFNFQMRF